MRYLMMGAAFALVFGGVAAASPMEDPLQAPIHKFIDAFNKGDVKTAASTHVTGSVTIIDEVPPHIWTGPTAFMDWVRDLTNDDKKNGVTKERVTLGDPVRQELNGARAYVVDHATYSFEDHGKPMSEAAFMTFALKKGPAGWKIAGWTWTGPKAEPAKP